MADAVVGVIANPLSGRDIRRLVAKASVFPTAEKANMIERMLTAFAAVGVQRVLLNTDLGGISAAVYRSIGRRRTSEPAWPQVEFLDQDEITQTAADTINAARRMHEAGARVVICLGGDGTARVTASALSDTPMLALSTGTNNAFPAVREATVAGLAAGLLATGAVAQQTAARRAKMLRVHVPRTGRTDLALVDVAVSRERHVGSRAVWDPSVLDELFCAFAEPDAIGLSSVPGQLVPVSRGDSHGAHVLVDPDAPTRVRAPIAPGLVADVGVQTATLLEPGAPQPVRITTGVIALDGEREITLDGTTATVTLDPNGPLCVDVPAVLAHAAAAGLLVTRLPPADRQPGAPVFPTERQSEPEDRPEHKEFP